jgi:FAD/FMN-containing dehydrogenase
MDLRRALAEVVGERHALHDPELIAPYESDWTGRWSGRATCVVRPGSTEEVASVMRACAEHGAAVVPQGGNTGLVGGGVPRDAVLLSLKRLAELGPHDDALQQITVGAGVTLAALRDAVPDPGLDFGARDSATIGGIAACDAGGARALRHGTARARVVGVEAVLADGSVVSSLGGLLKDNAGYALPFVGSEGTLGVITRVRWATVPRLRHRVAALIGVADVGEAVAVLGALRGPDLEACDFFTRECVPSLDAPLALLAEYASDHDPIADLAERLEGRDVSIADDTASRERLWALREGIPEYVQSQGVPVKLDVGVPLSRLADFLAAVPRVCGDARPFLFGHIGDGNVHVNLVGDAPDDDAVLGLVLDLGGTISAEHGVGVAKAAWLERAVGPEAYAAMRAVKRALDPQGILNPGVMFAPGE